MLCNSRIVNLSFTTTFFDCVVSCLAPIVVLILILDVLA